MVDKGLTKGVSLKRMQNIYIYIYISQTYWHIECLMWRQIKNTMLYNLWRPVKGKLISFLVQKASGQEMVKMNSAWSFDNYLVLMQVMAGILWRWWVNWEYIVISLGGQTLLWVLTLRGIKDTYISNVINKSRNN